MPALSLAVAGSWRARLAEWWHGNASTGLARPRQAQVRQPQVRRPALNPADRERILTTEAPPYVWGDSRVGPGGKVFYEKLLTPLGLQRDGKLLIVGAGLGWPAREISRQYGVQVLGLDPSSLAAAKGAELTEAEGLAGRVSLRPFNPEALKLSGRAQDCAFVEPLLFGVQNKLDLLREIDVTLKPGGKVVLLDYVVGAISDEMRPLWEEWQEAERPRPRPRTLGELKALFKKAKLRIRGAHDITPRYNAMITRSWASCVDRIEALPRAEQQDPVILGVAELAELWGRRSVLMERGLLRVVQVTATKAKFGR